MPMLTRVLAILACFVMASCAGPAPVPGSGAATGGAPDARGSGESLGDAPVMVHGSPSPRLGVQHNARLGSATAKIGIVEFSDYQCSFCRDFHRRQFAQLRKEYIDTGVVQFIHKDLPLRMHRHAVPAAVAARCARAQGRFWDMHDALFAHQEQLGPELYPELARRLQLDSTQFRECLDNQDMARAIARDTETARALGLTATPSFVIGTLEGDLLTVVRQARGAPDYEVFAQEIEKLRQAAGAPPR